MLTNFLPQKTSFSSPKAFSSLAFRQNQQTTSPAETIGMQSRAEKSLKPPKNLTFKKGFSESFVRQFDGAQKGIKIFEGLDILQTAIAMRNIHAIPLMRGCRNACSHCFLDAQVPIRNTDKHINSIFWEDLLSFTSGIKEFKANLGKDAVYFFMGQRKMYLFWDSEVIPAKIPDLKGGFHGAAEASEKIYDALKIPFLVDTSGWPIQDKWSQTQAQELARYFKEHPEALSEQINVSLNPFGTLMEKSFTLQNKGEFAKSRILRKKYIDRMVNVFATLLKSPVSIITRAEGTDDYAASSQKKLNLQILERLEKSLTPQELAGPNFELLKNHIEILNPNTISMLGERGSKFFNPDNVARKKAFLNNVMPRLDCFDNLAEANKLFDLNGRVYAATEHKQIYTDIQLNYINRDKLTSPFNNFVHQV